MQIIFFNSKSPYVAISRLTPSLINDYQFLSFMTFLSSFHICQSLRLKALAGTGSFQKLPEHLNRQLPQRLQQRKSLASYVPQNQIQKVSIIIIIL